MAKPTYERSYLGVTITAANYRHILEREERNGINFHTKHLRAYLKGKEVFTHGFQKDENGKTVRDKWGHPIPISHRVQSVLRKIPTENVGATE